MVDRQVPVAEVQVAHRLGQAHRELVADRAHPKARAAAADPARQLDPDQGGVVDGRGRGEGQAQPLVDRRTDGAGLGAHARRREQDVRSTIPFAPQATANARTNWGVLDYSALVAAVARHRVNTPQLAEGSPDAFWRAAALMEQLVLLRPLPARNEFFAYGVAVAYLRAL
ncbi:hypothetical protein [Streptomyces canus]|uniref:hypothetical protein n=1 Tax=Streptomyces canus TaxID=58343 RepID=UPI003863CBE4